MTTDHDQNDSAAKYCLQCGYSLFGLPETRCPECGHAFDANDPDTYADFPKRFWMSTFWCPTTRNALLAFAALVLLLVIGEMGVTRESRFEKCPLCGADSHVKHFSFFGLGGDYGRIVREGPISQFVQRHSRTKCPHPWITASMESGGIFAGARASYSGLALPRTALYEGYSEVKLTLFLEDKAYSDPHFTVQLKGILKNRNQDITTAFFEALMAQAVEWQRRQESAAPASQGTDSPRSDRPVPEQMTP